MKSTYTWIFILFVTATSYAQQHIEGEIELAGFLIGQERKTVHTELGPPIQRKLNDGWVYEFHKIKPDTSVYALFKYAKWDTTHIYAIQLSGSRYYEMTSFRGLKLGASRAAVDQSLGTPDKVENIDGMTLLYYPHKNFSVDFDERGRLFGIQIFGNILKNKSTFDSSPSIKRFRHAVTTKNVDSVLQYIHPNVEVVKNGKTTKFSRAARHELTGLDTEFSKAILGETASVWYAFAKEYAEGTNELKAQEESGDLVCVDKFFDSNVLAEIILKPHAGRWKVSRIVFR